VGSAGTLFNMARLTQDTYSVARPTGRCAHTGQDIPPGGAYIAALADRKDEDALERIDYSLDAWSQGARPPRLFGFWRAVMPQGDEKPRLFIEDDDLLAMFDQLGDEATDDPDDGPAAFRFVLALILMRKRLLKHVGAEERQNRRWMLVRRKGEPSDATPTPVLDPAMDAQRVARVTEQLGAALRGEQ
jgi:hypothetical protein